MPPRLGSMRILSPSDRHGAVGEGGARGACPALMARRRSVSSLPLNPPVANLVGCDLPSSASTLPNAPFGTPRQTRWTRGSSRQPTICYRNRCGCRSVPRRRASGSCLTCRRFPRLRPSPDRWRRLLVLNPEDRGRSVTRGQPDGKPVMHNGPFPVPESNPAAPGGARPCCALSPAHERGP